MISTSDEPGVKAPKRRCARKASLFRAIKDALAAGMPPSEALLTPDGSVKLTFTTEDCVAPSPKNDWD